MRAPAFSVAVFLFALCSPPTSAQDAASTPVLPKQVRIVTASVGGTGPDFIARLIAPKLAEGARVNVIVENRPSVNGIVAAQFVAKAPADGSVLIMGNAGTHAINAALYRKLPYDPIADFAPISEIASIPLALVIHPVSYRRNRCASSSRSRRESPAS